MFSHLRGAGRLGVFDQQVIKTVLDPASRAIP